VLATVEIGVFDASPLIALAQIGRLAPLPQLYDEVVVPPTILMETSRSVGQPDWFVVRAPVLPHDVQSQEASLGPGESEVIALALQFAAEVVLDDRPARRLALRLDLPIVGVVGLLQRAKRRGLIEAVRPELVALRSHEFFLDDRGQQQALIDAGENP
jgi:hypothetical protein